MHNGWRLDLLKIFSPSSDSGIFCKVQLWSITSEFLFHLCPSLQNITFYRPPLADIKNNHGFLFFFSFALLDLIYVQHDFSSPLRWSFLPIRTLTLLFIFKLLTVLVLSVVPPGLWSYPHYAVSKPHSASRSVRFHFPPPPLVCLERGLGIRINCLYHGTLPRARKGLILSALIPLSTICSSYVCNM